jgi:hypothetical protein
MTKDKNMSDAKLDILIQEIQGLRKDITMLAESKAPAQQPYVAPQQTTVSATPSAAPQAVNEKTDTIFGIPVPKRSDENVTRQETMSIKERAKAILA